MPEEHNRVLTDHLSSVLLVHSERRSTTSRARGSTSGWSHFVGNTMIDSRARARRRGPRRGAWEQLGVQPGEYGLVTLHRPALVDDPAMLSAGTKG